jgi:hypothetical protein
MAICSGSACLDNASYADRGWRCCLYGTGMDSGTGIINV